jgi:hypothetical protein
MAKRTNPSKLNPPGARPIVFSLLLVLVLAGIAAAGGQWSIFKGQVNGPVARPSRIDPNTYRGRGVARWMNLEEAKK